MAKTDEVIAAARQGFEAAFAEQHFYEKQTRDDSHLQALLGLLPVTQGMRVLDLGTGSGYLAFALAEQFPHAAVTGLDIAQRTLAENQRRADAAQMQNLRFVSYDGGAFPFQDGAFDLVLSRYALHHFPEIGNSLAEISRVLTVRGHFLLSDPAPDAGDAGGFLDAFMRVKPDGHVRFYSAADWESLCAENGLFPVRAFQSSIRFPRHMQPEYAALISRFGAEALSLYDLQVRGNEVYVTAQVNNMLFCKSASTRRNT